jgi:hypothetical protein
MCTISAYVGLQETFVRQTLTALTTPLLIEAKTASLFIIANDVETGIPSQI